jgi:putative ABC transport system permease protein
VKDTTRVPRAAERLLEAALAGSVMRDAVLGDLHEEYLARATRSSGARLRTWYWCEAVRLTARFGIRRVLIHARQPREARAAAAGAPQETYMSSLTSDVKHALRAIRKQPGVSLVVAVTLALGLGINATVLGMMDALLLRPFQFRDAAQLVVVWETVHGGSGRETVAPANFLDWRAQARSVEQLIAWAWLDATLTGRGGDPERVQGFRVSPGFFELLGITPVLGRTFVPDDEQMGNHRRVILGDGLWKRRFGGEPAILGSDILVDGTAHTVVGIAPPTFAFPVGSELWVPLAFTPAQTVDRENRPLTVAGRLAGEQPLAAVQAEMDVIAGRLSREHPQTNGERGVSVRPLSTAFREDSTVPFVGILQAAAGLVLLVACANIAGLLLARAIDRQREIAVRTALGASRGRIVRQLVTETVVLGLLASAIAIPIAMWSLDVLRSSIPAETARFVEGWNNLRFDARLALAIPALAIAVGLLIGLVPALAATRTALTDALREGDRATGGVRRQRTRQMLVVGEIALALALLIAAGLTVNGGRQLANDPGGFDPRGLLTLQIPLPDGRYGDAGVRREFADALIARLESVPTVQRAALANILPASGWSPASSFVVEHDPDPEPARRPRAGYRAVSARFFETMRVPILKGRPFSTIDREDSQAVTIVSASLAERFWPGQNPVGRRLRLDGSRHGWLQIVGVAGDLRMYNWWDGEDALAVYVPLRQAPPEGLAYATIRAHGDPSAITSSVREAVKAVDALLPVSNVRTMREAIADSGAGLNHLALLMAVCGGIGLGLAVVGIYSVMSYAVSRRMYEFGVRMALGATARDLLTLTLAEAGALTGTGLGLGLVLAVVLGRMLSSALFGLIALHPLTFAAVGAGLACVSLGAACVPARRALRLDPSTILRGQ